MCAPNQDLANSTRRRRYSGTVQDAGIWMGARHDPRGNNDRELRAGIRITTSADANGVFRNLRRILALGRGSVQTARAEMTCLEICSFCCLAGLREAARLHPQFLTSDATVCTGHPGVFCNDEAEAD